jgi:hypothetical protein
MAITNLQHVQPGDLIKAEDMNRLLDALQLLDVRVTSLETGDGGNRAPILLQRSPSGDIEVNSPLTLIGRNFLLPSDRNTVTLGGVPINQFNADSDETNLIFTVPDVFSALPRTVQVSVRNEFGESTELNVGLLPHVVTQGGLVVIFDQTPPLDEIVVGNTYTLSWLVDSQTVLPVTYNFTLEFTNVVGATVSLWRSDSNVNPSGPREIRRGNPQLVTATVRVPEGATSAQVALRAESTDHAFGRTSATLALEVGETPEVSDPRVLMTRMTIPPLDAVTGGPNPVRLATINGVDGVEVRFGQTGRVPINMHVGTDQSAAGTYNFTATVEDAAGLWTGGPVAPTTLSRTAPSDRTLQATIQNTDTGNTTTVKFMVVRATHRTAAGVEDFNSFIRFPIRGFVA